MHESGVFFHNCFFTILKDKHGRTHLLSLMMFTNIGSDDRSFHLSKAFQMSVTSSHIILIALQQPEDVARLTAMTAFGAPA